MEAQRRPYTVYIVLTPFREIAPSVRVMFRALEKLEAHLEYVEGFYRDDGDEALVALQFQRAVVDKLGSERVCAAVRQCNLPIIAPEGMNLERRVRFAHEHLTSFPTRVQKYRSPDEPMLQGIVLALEEHVAYEVQDDHYDMVEVSNPEIAMPAEARTPPAGDAATPTSPWDEEGDTPAGDGDDDDAPPSSESDFWF